MQRGDGHVLWGATRVKHTKTYSGKNGSEALIPSFAASLKSTATNKDLHQGARIHADIRAHGLLNSNTFLGNMVVNMYIKCGALSTAQQVLDEEMPARDIVTWSSLIAGYVQQGQVQEALKCYERMQRESIYPNAVTYACILKACSIIGDLKEGARIHDEIVTRGLLVGNVVLVTALISMYANCGALLKAKQVLDGLHVRNVFAWSALIAGYVHQGKGKEALRCWERMQHEGFSPNAITYTSLLKACAITGDLDKGKRIHEHILGQSMLRKDVVLGNALVDMYVKCNAVTKADQVLRNEMSVRNVISWSTLIAGCSQQGKGKEALDCYRQMQEDGLTPDVGTYVSVLKACSIIGDIDKGKQIHHEIVIHELMRSNSVINNALIDMYAKCGAITKAQKVLDEFPARSVVSWNALIGGYTHLGKGREALDCFERMQSEQIPADATTYACILKACGITKQLDRGRHIHDEITVQGLPDGNIVLGNALIDMYAKCCEIAKAKEILEGLADRDVVSWNALICGYIQQGCGKEALECYERMRTDGIYPDAVVYSGILKACGLMGELEKGEQVHATVRNQGLLESDIVLGNALIDMYVKCGAVAKARQVLEKEMPSRNEYSWSTLISGYAQQGESEQALDCFEQIRQNGFTPNRVCWNALIGGYAQQGLAKEALNCFRWMEHEGMPPDAVTFICVLNACSHSGLVDEGQMYFKNMEEKYGIIPEMEHCICMIDLFTRAGHFNKATSLIRSMPACDHPPLWSALLSACGKWGNLDLGRLAFDCAMEFDEPDPTAHV
ncbi:hypothetical protein KP509_09G092300 [Ceratopteris richardii]|uniref:Pentatricopeptide repeat-containing protein n=1 Tax=Ceratopteris richardii TaxID=49495 RepID=A0A8T2U6W9_CERRI|nr:hypothetical protein KP509_09G092300 [Ceratopteris richardii]KAH7430301.1 hypothetical protein KP509_09G092300 [Ceratopteris richardii]